MAFTIQYLANGESIAVTSWPTDLPPTRAFARQGIRLRGADKAIIRDEEGERLTVILDIDVAKMGTAGGDAPALHADRNG